MEKYKLVDGRAGNMRSGRAVGLRNLEAGINKLERECGIDLDGDGDIGVPSTSPSPPVAVARAPTPSVARIPTRARPISADASHSAGRRSMDSSRRHVPGYAGFTPNRNPLGVSTFAHERSQTETECEGRRLQSAADRAWRRPLSEPRNVPPPAKPELYMA